MLPCMDTQIMQIDLFMGESAQWHCSQTHMHMFTTAYGTPERRMGMLVDGSSTSTFYIAEGKPFDGCLKLTGVWMVDGKPEDSVSPVFPLHVVLNGVDIWSDDLHMPVVCAGWPSVYLRIPPGILRNGCNDFKLETYENSLLINQCSIFLRNQSDRLMEPVFTPRVLTVGREFCVTLTFYNDASNVQVDHGESIEAMWNSGECTRGEHDFVFRSVAADVSPRLSILADGERVDIQLPPILDIASGLPCYVGVDSDDHRQDNTGMMSEILRYTFRSELGDFITIRPKLGRNCTQLPSKELLSEWIDICHEHGARYMFSDWGTGAAFPPDISHEIAKDPAFVGCHAHETYFRMIEPWCNDDKRITSASNFQEKRDAYVASLKKWADKCHSAGVRAATGEASWLAQYDKEAGYDIINAEVVTGFGPHFAAVNGALRGRPDMESGHHIAVEWYLGYPYDDLKSRRFWLMMLLSYASGAQYIYAENSMFFTNSYERHDPEDKFTSDNRRLMRKFFDITKLQPRSGEICPELAAVYGNLESILWYRDDILPEVNDGSEWGDKVWCKWPGGEYRNSWRALDALLPPVEIEKYNDNPSILKWFSGNPYGNVEITSIEQTAKILSNYKVLAFLGWNTMTLDIIQKLKKYVSCGGTLFISGCHFDKRVLIDGDYIIDTSGAEDLLGLSVAGVGEAVADVIWQGKRFNQSSGNRLCSSVSYGAETVLNDENGNPVLFHNRYGNGEVYFCNFWDHPAADDSVRLTKSILAYLGERAKGDFGLEDGYGITCTHWYDQDTDTHRLYLVNTNWQNTHASQLCMVRLWGRAYPVAVTVDDMKIITIKGNAAVIPDSSMVYVDDISLEEDCCHVSLTGLGDHLLRLILPDGSCQYTVLDMRGKKSVTVPLISSVLTS